MFLANLPYRHFHLAYEWPLLQTMSPVVHLVEGLMKACWLITRVHIIIWTHFITNKEPWVSLLWISVESSWHPFIEMYLPIIFNASVADREILWYTWVQQSLLMPQRKCSKGSNFTSGAPIKYLSQWCPSQLAHKCVTWLQFVNSSVGNNLFLVVINWFSKHKDIFSCSDISQILCDTWSWNFPYEKHGLIL